MLALLVGYISLDEFYHISPVNVVGYDIRLVLI